jgi:hypothetical protein
VQQPAFHKFDLKEAGVEFVDKNGGGPGAQASYARRSRSGSTTDRYSLKLNPDFSVRAPMDKLTSDGNIT